MSTDRPVLVIGSTGYLGAKVVRALLARGRRVRALVRPGTDPSAIVADGVAIVRGDLLDPASIEAAMHGVDAVVSSAAGYMKRRKTDSAEADTMGMRNLAAAAKVAGVRRVVLTGIVKSDVATSVPHFHHKALAEQALEDAGVPFVSVRAGAFLDQSTDMLLDGVKKGRVVWLVDRSVRNSWILTDDLADHLAAAVDLPGTDSRRIDVGWTRNVSLGEIVDIVGQLTGRTPSVWIAPWWLAGTAMAAVGVVSELARDLRAMFAFFRSGQYALDDLGPQRAAFGEPPTPEDAIARWLQRGGVALADEAA